MLINKNKIVILYISIIFFLSSCAEKTLLPEEEIKAYISAAKQSAESRSHNDLADLISEHYQDQKSLNKKKIASLARAYFFRHKNIHLFTKLDSINFQKDKEAFVVVYVAMAGTAITDVNMLSNLRARIYRFELLLIKNNEWLLQQARWSPAKLTDIL